MRCFGMHVRSVRNRCMWTTETEIQFYAQFKIESVAAHCCPSTLTLDTTWEGMGLLCRFASVGFGHRTRLLTWTRTLQMELKSFMSEYDTDYTYPGA
jgi:hypothetical protein